MRELLYLSERKLFDMFVDPGRLPGVRARGVDASLSFLGATAKLASEASAADVQEAPAAVAAKLERVIRYLDLHRHPAALDVDTPELRPNQWIRFDLDLSFGSAHQDSVVGEPDDVVLFTGTVKPLRTAGRETSLLLCGSVQHVRTRIASAGRMGSDTGWLHAAIETLHKREAAGIHVIPEFPGELAPTDLSLVSPEEVTQWVFGMIERNHPEHQRGRLAGHARVLLDIRDPRWLRRLVLATPLYVEIPPDVPRRGRWQRIFRGPRRERLALESG